MVLTEHSPLVIAEEKEASGGYSRDSQRERSA